MTGCISALVMNIASMFSCRATRTICRSPFTMVSAMKLDACAPSISGVKKQPSLRPTQSSPSIAFAAAFAKATLPARVSTSASDVSASISDET